MKCTPLSLYQFDVDFFLYYLCQLQMKKTFIILFFIACFTILDVQTAEAQCSICTKTAQQLGEKPAKGLNAGIIYLMLTPFAIVGFVGYRWWKKNKDV